MLYWTKYNMIIVVVIIILLLVVVGIIIYNKRKRDDLKKKKAKRIAAVEFERDRKNELYSDVVLDENDVDLTPNDQYLGTEPADESDTVKALKAIGSFAKDMGIGILLTDVPLHLSKKAAQALSKKLFAKFIATSSAKTLAKVSLKIGANVAKSASKFASPVSWALLYLDLPGALWDVTNTGKLGTFQDANTWLLLRDEMKKNFEKDLKNNPKYDPPIVKGPLDKFETAKDKRHPNVTETQFDQFISEKAKIVYDINTRYYDKFYHEAKNKYPSLSEEQILEKIEPIYMKTEEIRDNSVIKKMCDKYGGKYLGKGKCSFETKQECMNSYSWPLKEEHDIYGHWDGDKCVYSYGGLVRNVCDQESSAQIGYNADYQTCYIKKPYCDQYNISYKDKDPEAKNFPNCYKTTEREILELAIGGETVIKDIEDLFSSRENCDNQCNPDTQYCYTITGKGGICLAKSNPGEACTTDIDASCYGDSKCKLSGEGLAAAIGTGLAVVGTGGMGLAGLVAAGAAGRAIHANLGVCSAGADGINPSSSSNPGHYMKIGMKGCYAGLKCPPKVKHADGTTKQYWCKTGFNECQPPKQKGEWCSAVEICDKHNGKEMWCGGVPVQCRTKDGKDGDFCEWNSDYCASGHFCDELSRCRKLKADGSACLYSNHCASGDCIGGVCAKKIGSKTYLQKGALCGLANTKCEPDTYCDGFTCVGKKNPGQKCLAGQHSQCKSGKCLGNTCAKKVGSKYYTPKSYGCALDRGSCEPGTFCSVNATCDAKKAKGGVCFSDSVCASNSCSWFTCN